MAFALHSLTEKQRQAAMALCDPNLAILSDKALAEKLGVSDRSLRRWREDPVFVEALQEIRENPDYEYADLLAHREEVDSRLLDLCRKGNVRAIQLYYEVTGVLYQAKHSQPTEFNAIKIVFEPLGSRSADVQVVEVSSEPA